MQLKGLVQSGCYMLKLKLRFCSDEHVVKLIVK
jgi:hypothetical protein